jgi:5-methylcytosine-specific restriction enzyme A
VNPLNSLRPLHEGRTYTRKEVLVAIGVSPVPTGGNWYTGYTSFRGAHFIFCNVGAAGRTGHDYPNQWITRTRLRWLGKTGSKSTSPQVMAMTRGDEPVYLFYRSDNRASFTFAGKVRAIELRDTRPVEVVWEFSPAEVPTAQEVLVPDTFTEGAVRRIEVNSYERDRTARMECIRYYGHECQVCGFRFLDLYGEIGRNFIHVHHIVSLSSIREQYRVDPVRDLRPVCANCHAMLHTQEPPLSIQDLKARLLRPGAPLTKTMVGR